MEAAGCRREVPQKALVLKVTGTSKVAVLTPQKRADKAVLTQREIGAQDLVSGQVVALVYADAGKEGVILLSAKAARSAGTGQVRTTRNQPQGRRGAAARGAPNRGWHGRLSSRALFCTHLRTLPPLVTGRPHSMHGVPRVLIAGGRHFTELSAPAAQHLETLLANRLLDVELAHHRRAGVRGRCPSAVGQWPVSRGETGGYDSGHQDRLSDRRISAGRPGPTTQPHARD